MAPISRVTRRRIRRSHPGNQLLETIIELTSGPRRPQLEDVGAQGLDHAVQAVDRLLDRGGSCPIRHPFGDPLQGESDREQVLYDGVMEVAGDPLPILTHRDRSEAALKTRRGHGGAGNAAERFDQHHVVVGEPAVLLSQVEIAERLSPGRDRNAEEGAHRRMVRRESIRVRMLRYRVETDGSVLPHQRPEDPLAGGKRPDSVHLLRA